MALTHTMKLISDLHGPLDVSFLQEHRQAVARTRAGFESAVMELLRALAEYADAHRDRYESEVGEDGVLGDHFEEIARGLLGLLNGETGRLDCGTLDGAIRKLCKAAKVEGIEQ